MAGPTLHFPGGCSRLVDHVTAARALEGGGTGNVFGWTLKEQSRDCPENAGVTKPLLAFEASCTREGVRSRGSVSEGGEGRGISSRQPGAWAIRTAPSVSLRGYEGDNLFPVRINRPERGHSRALVRNMERGSFVPFRKWVHDLTSRDGVLSCISC